MNTDLIKALISAVLSKAKESRLFRWLLYILVLLATALALSTQISCSRSTLRFKGTGEVEYQYTGNQIPISPTTTTPQP